MGGYNPDASSMVAVEADGSWVTDIDGDRNLDGMAGMWGVNVGYGREELAKAAYEQLRTMPYYPMSQSHLPAIELSEKLSERLDGEYVIRHSNSGFEANETAFKMTRQYHALNGEPGRYKFVAPYRNITAIRSGPWRQPVRRSAGIFTNRSPQDFCTWRPLVATGARSAATTQGATWSAPGRWSA